MRGVCPNAAKTARASSFQVWACPEPRLKIPFAFAMGGQIERHGDGIFHV